MILRVTFMGNFWYIASMRVLFVADGRSPIALNWMRYFVQQGDEVYLASTFDCSPDLPLKGYRFTPVAFSSARRGRPSKPGALSTTSRTRAEIRHWLGPLTISRAARALREYSQNLRPDLVHAMRIPFEGMLAADAYAGTPLLISVWGNDLTLHAPTTPMMRQYTTWTLQVAHALHTDCLRDVRLGKQWGFAPGKPTLVIPGNGGIRSDTFHPPEKPVEQPIVLNPRGARTYVRNDVFFQAIPLVLGRRPEAKFLCAALADNREAIQWMDRLHLQRSVELLPPMPHNEMAALFRRAQVVVSPSVHDGTPNSLLEGMACGCLPVAGDLESIREWITDGTNGLLADATSPQNLAQAILEALENKDLRHHAAGLNKKIIMERAEYGRCMAQAAGFYRRIAASTGVP
jgi:glycosyl transferase family 1/glycosyl transferase family 4